MTKLHHPNPEDPVPTAPLASARLAVSDAVAVAKAALLDAE